MTKKIYFLKFIPLIIMVLYFSETYSQKYSIDDQKQMSSPKKRNFVRQKKIELLIRQ